MAAVGPGLRRDGKQGGIQRMMVSQHSGYGVVRLIRERQGIRPELAVGQVEVDLIEGSYKLLPVNAGD